MTTHQEVIRRPEDVAREIVELKRAVAEAWGETLPKDSTLAFLQKCGGWEDSRAVEEIVADICLARTISNSRTNIFNDEQSA